MERMSLLLFPGGIHSLLGNISLPSQINSEALQLAAAARIIRRHEIFQLENNFQFEAKFPAKRIVCLTISFP